MGKTTLLAILLTAMMANANADLPGQGITVKPVQSTLAEETFQTLLVSRALEALGYSVEAPSQMDYDVAHQTVAAGDATFMADNWQPLHDQMYRAAGGDNRLYRQGSLVTGAAQGYLIDHKTAQQYGITHLEQLRDPDIARLFDTNGDGKADLTGCRPGWGCEAAISHQLGALKIDQFITHHQDDYVAMIAATITRYRKGKPILYYTWSPYWLNNVLIPGRDVVWLQAPLPGHADNQPDDAHHGMPANTIHIVANRAWAGQNPAAARLFAIMTLPIADINAQNAMMRDGKNTPADIQGHVDGWIKGHQATFDNWISEALAADDRPI